MTLDLVPAGTMATIISISTARKRPLGDIGISPGQRLRVLGRFPCGGALLLQTGDALTAVEPMVARQIQVAL